MTINLFHRHILIVPYGKLNKHYFTPEQDWHAVYKKHWKETNMEQDEGTPREQVVRLTQGLADIEEQLEILNKTKLAQAETQRLINEAQRLLEEQQKEVEAKSAALSLPLWQELLDAGVVAKLRSLTTPLAPSPSAVLIRLVDDEIARRSQIQKVMKKRR